VQPEAEHDIRGRGEWDGLAGRYLGRDDVRGDDVQATDRDGELVTGDEPAS
jgi:hypothetical protein